MVLTTRMLTPETWEDFAALVESNNGVWGGCWCMGFHPGGSTGSLQGNRDAKQQLVDRGMVHQVLVYPVASTAMYAASVLLVGAPIALLVLAFSDFSPA